MPAIQRKIKTIAFDRGLKVSDTIKFLDDCIRYTLVFEPDVYTAQVKASLTRLETEGSYKIDGVLNYWKAESPYKGVYAFVSTGPDSLPFEVQFHTPESYNVKEEKVDDLLEKLTTLTDPEEARTMYLQAEAIWKAVGVPRKAKKIAWPIVKGKSCIIL